MPIIKDKIIECIVQHPHCLEPERLGFKQKDMVALAKNKDREMVQIDIGGATHVLLGKQFSNFGYLWPDQVGTLIKLGFWQFLNQLNFCLVKPRSIESR